MVELTLKKIFLLIVSVLIAGYTFTQEISKDTIQGLWKICGAYEIDEKLDTLIFTRSTPDCKKNECGTHNWKFLQSGTVTYIFTDGCESGFHSKNKPSKKWMLKAANNQIVFITNDGWKEVFEIISYKSDELVLVHRFDLEN